MNAVCRCPWVVARLPRVIGVVICLAFVALLSLTAAATRVSAEEPSADLYVATDGNDAFSGRLAVVNAERTDGPVATIARAQALVRQLKSQPPGKRPIVVMVCGGTYFLDQPLQFTPEDSGAPDAPIVYQAYPGERPVISGGRPIDGWTVGDDGRWSVVLDGVKQGNWRFSQLFVNDQRRLRPRLPKQGYYRIGEEVPTTVEKPAKGFNRMGFGNDEIRPDWANLSDVEVVTFQFWGISRMRIAGVDAQAKIATFTGKTYTDSWWSKFTKGHRYFVENVREALSEPGEWYLDRPSGTLAYIPKPGETPSNTKVIAPRLERLVELVGDRDGRRWVQHLTFRGLTFAHAAWNLAPGGQVIPQAEVTLDSAIRAVAARNIAFDTCAVRHTGQYAMAFGPGCRDNVVENCELVDLGAGGVKIGHVGPSDWGGTHHVPSDAELVVSHHTVRNCLIAHGGRLHPAAIGVWIGLSNHNRVVHNDIFDFYYSATSVGWQWGYADTPTHHNEVAYNHAHTLGQAVLSDMGGIYTLGVQPGTHIHHNIFHDVDAQHYGGWGLYTDEGSSQIVMENNLVYRTKTGGFHQHYGRDNQIRNNIFADAKVHQIQRTRKEDHLSFAFEHNIVYWDNDSPLLGGNWQGDTSFRSDYNLFFHAGSPEWKVQGNKTLAAWQEEGRDRHSLVADPGFVDAAHDNFTLKPDSPALKVGFKPFDVSTAGRQTSIVLTKDLPPVPKTYE